MGKPLFFSELELLGSKYIFGARAGAFKQQFVLVKSELGAFWLQFFSGAQAGAQILRAKQASFALKVHFNFTH